MDQDPEITAMFFDEVESSLDVLNDGLMNLEQDIEAVKNDPEKINELFRAFHSIKGASAMLGFSRINQLTHRGETLLDKVREGSLNLEAPIVEALFEAVDGLTKLIEELKSNEEVLDLEPIFKLLDNACGGHVPQKQTTTSSQDESSNKTKEDIKKYLNSFLADASEAITSMEASILKIEDALKNSNHQIDQETIDDIFRSAHLLKAGSASLGFMKLSELTHAIETALDKIRSGQLKLSLTFVSSLLDSLDLIKESINSIANDGDGKIEIGSVTSQIHSFMGNQPQNDSLDKSSSFELTDSDIQHITDAQQKGDCVYQINADLSNDDDLSGLHAMMAVEKLSEMGKLIKSHPDQKTMAEADKLKSFLVILATDKDEKELAASATIDQVKNIKIKQLEKQSSQALPEAKSKTAKSTVTSPSSNIQTMRVDIERLEKLMNMSGELVISKARFEQVDSELKEILDQKNILNRIQFLLNGLETFQKSNDASSGSLHVFRDRIDLMHKECQHLFQVAQKLGQGKLVYQNFQDALHQMDLVSNGIQKSIMDIRMVPVGPLFGRFKRVVRDLCKTLGKQVNLVVQGEDTDLDKKVIDELTDPLTHIVRNALDHGMETPDVRQKSGKDKAGVVTLAAFHKGNHICISIKDDGKGIDTDILKNKALEKEIFTSEALEKMSQKEALNLIFHPGFSTAQKITNISGRGVGMDIVRKKIEDLNGWIDIESQKGKGTTFTIFLPLTLAVQKSLLCKIQNTTYAIPIDFVSEIIMLDSHHFYSVQEDKVFSLRDKVIPVKHLSEIFKSSPNIKKPNAHIDTKKSIEHTLVIIGDHETTFGLMVDSLVGEQDIVVKSLSHNLKNVVGLSGAAILGSGDIALILDIASLLENMNKPTSYYNNEAGSLSEATM